MIRCIDFLFFGFDDIVIDYITTQFALMQK